MESRLLEWVKSILESRDYNRRWLITERRDGSWICQAFTSKNVKLAEIEINNHTEAWRVLMLLTGNSWDENTEIIKERLGEEVA